VRLRFGRDLQKGMSRQTLNRNGACLGKRDPFGNRDGEVGIGCALRDIEKFAIEETARLLGLPIPVVKTRLLRSRLKLREELTKYFGKDARNAMPTAHR
jgi:hypothetical protein